MAIIHGVPKSSPLPNYKSINHNRTNKTAKETRFLGKITVSKKHYNIIISLN